MPKYPHYREVQKIGSAKCRYENINNKKKELVLYTKNTISVREVNMQTRVVRHIIQNNRLKTLYFDIKRIKL